MGIRFQHSWSLALFLLVPLGSAQAAEKYIFTAPPRGTVEKETKIYQPIADYLSKATGKQIIYEHPDNWLTYQSNMQKGRYDLVFDGPHFVAWRMATLQHEPLARLPGKLIFVVFVREDNTKIEAINHIAGRTVCALAPPNLATLTVYAQFDNPLRQPLVLKSRNFKENYIGVKSGKCIAGVVRDKHVKKFNIEGVKFIFQSKGVANQAFSAGNRFSDKDKETIRQALLAPGATEKLKAFMDRFNKKKRKLLPASRKEYEGLHVLLKDIWGFQIKQTKFSE